MGVGYYAGRKLGSISEIRKRIQHYEDYVIVGLIAAAIVMGLYLWWRHRKHTPLSKTAIDKVDVAATRVLEGQAAGGGLVPPAGSGPSDG